MANAPEEGLNQVILRKVQRFLTKKVAKTFASTHYKLPFINANNFHKVCFLLHCHLDEKALWQIAKSPPNGNQRNQPSLLYLNIKVWLILLRDT